MTRKTAAIQKAIYDLLAQDNPMTVRQVFYQLVCRRVVDKTEAGYKIVQPHLAHMREDGVIPYEWISDPSRWIRKPSTWSSLDDALTALAAQYRRAVWDSQAKHVDVWLEKEALAGIVGEITAELDVPLMVARGFSSLSFLHQVGLAVAARTKPTMIYLFGDYDPSGECISDNIKRRLRQFAPNADLHFEQVAITPEQIDTLQLPTRPTKKSDPRASRFDGESVELDALEPRVLRDLVRECIVRHINNDALSVIRNEEASEREWLSHWSRHG